MAVDPGPALLLLLWLVPTSGQLDERDHRRPADQPVVESFRLEGVTAVDESDLRSALSTRASSRLPWGRRHYFDPAAFEEDLERIESFYDEHGYPDATVVASRIDVNEARNTVRLHVVVEEGEPLLVSAVELENFDALPLAIRERLPAALPLQPGEPLVFDRALAARDLSAALLRDHGYPFAQVSLDRRPAKDAVVVVLRALPGELSYFGRIDIEGNVSVDDTVIRRQLAYRPGEMYRHSAIRETLARLETLELFESANIELVPHSGPVAEIPTRLEVREGDHHRYEFSFGYGSEEQASVEAEWRHVNFLGGARLLALRGKWSWLDRGIEGTLGQPHFQFAPRLSLLLQGQAWHYDERLFDALSSGGRATLTYRLGPNSIVSAMVSHQFHRNRLTSEALRETLREELVARGLDPETGVQRGLLSSVGGSLQWQRTDHPVSPTRGYRASLVAEQAGGWLPGIYNYASTVGDLRSYRTPGAGVVLAARARYGSIASFRGEAGVPFSRRYFLGGANSLRGWGRLEVAPLSAAGVPLGGNSFLDASVEIRTPSWRGFSAVAFVDAGNVWRQSWTLRLDDLLFAAGPGLRYASPFGLLRLDVGYQLNRLEGLRIDGQPQDRSWRLHVSVGHVF